MQSESSKNHSIQRIKLEIVAEGLDLEKLAQYEGKFNEGDKGEARFYLDSALSEYQLQAIREKLTEIEAEVSQSHNVLVVKFRKGVFPLLPIVIAVSALGASFFGWQLFKQVSQVPIWAWVLGLAVVGYLVLREVKK